MRTRIPATAAAAVSATALLAPVLPAHAAARPAVIGHRGYTGSGCTENTTCAFGAALSRGADGVELDVRYTRTGYPVIMHDATVNRTTTGSGKVSSMNLPTFLKLHTNDGGHPPTLAQALYAVRKKGGRAFVELKTVPTKAQLARFDTKIKKSGLARSRINVQSFSAAAALKAKGDGWHNCRLLTYGTTASWTWKYDAIGVPYAHVSKAGVAKLHKHGVDVYPYTVNDASAWRPLAAKNVDAIISDRNPALIRTAVG